MFERGRRTPVRNCIRALSELLGTRYLWFEPTKSTKGASKMRRDLINAEISNLRELLPLPPSTRQRLSQLQLMALVCVYVRKMNYFQQRRHQNGRLFPCCDRFKKLITRRPIGDLSHLSGAQKSRLQLSVSGAVDSHTEYRIFQGERPLHGLRLRFTVDETDGLSFIFQAMNGFMMIMTQNGKLLYISENAAEYLGHSMEDLLIHGDSVYDIIDRQDHQAVQMELNRGTNGETEDVPKTRHFFCRMNVSRNARRQMRFGDQKVVLVRGHYVSYLPLCSRNEPVFVATCAPLAMPETRECVVLGATNVFTTLHALDMKILHLDNNAECYLGWTKSELVDVSWYQLLHWENLREAQTKHRLLLQSEQEKCCILLVRWQTRSGRFLWTHVVLQVKDAQDAPAHLIVATNQVLSEEEASIMLANSWLYQYYGYQNQPCGMIDPRCQKFFRREPFYQDTYAQEQFPYSVENIPEQEYPAYHIVPYPQKSAEEYMNCERVYSERGPVDYSTHSPQSNISEDRSPHHYEPPPDLVINGNMYMYPSQHATKREYYDPRIAYNPQEQLMAIPEQTLEYPKRMRVAPPPLNLEGTDGMERWNPSPPWSDSAMQKSAELQRFTYSHMAHIAPNDRTMVT
ncbi:Neuronal PAS domain-containing protein 4 [Eumeta japonica]|uniref:Neuronal PAS domain-containing protein 4 n=1 Tax=Eumeta variegata TaxID=151549 RepID=A0A4C1TQD6_EUMVA|nr:Neuronal PAS domain-containing protein 4 [Eumeta japonica]